MATMIPPQKNVQYVFYIGLVSQADTKLLQAAPTIAAGDFKVSTDGGAFANLDTLPDVDPDAGTAVKITLSADEMNGDNIVVTCIDAADAEWCDLFVNIQTSDQSLDTMDTNIDDIKEDTGTTLDALIKDIPTVAEFEARSILAANYVVVGDTIAGVTAVINDVGITQAGADKVRASACVTGDPANSIGKVLYELYTNRLTSTRAGYFDNLSAGAVALEVTLTAIKGSGWSDETLKAIKDAVDTITSAAIADAIWDELQSEHTDTGSFGKYLDAQISGVGSAVGPGALSCTWTQKDDDENPMDNCQVWVTTDSAGANVIAGAIITNAQGEVTFMLDAGTYYVWREKGSYNFTNPQEWTVS